MMLFGRYIFIIIACIKSTLTQILNDKVGWKERHTLMDGRLLISFIAVCFSGFAIVYDFIHPFPKSKMVRLE